MNNRRFILVVALIVGGIAGVILSVTSYSEARAKVVVPRPPAEGVWMVLQGDPPRPLGRLTLGKDRGSWQPQTGRVLSFTAVRSEDDEGLKWELSQSLPGLGSFLQIVIRDQSWIMRAKDQELWIEPLDGK